jgi:transposase InsO family protein
MLEDSKAAAIQRYEVPKSVVEVRSFYGLVNFCRDFLPGLATVAAPLTELTKKGVQFNWENKHQKAFEEVKKLVREAVELRAVRDDRECQLQTDASDVGIGAVLLQEFDGIWCPVAVASRKLNDHERNYPTHEKELLAIVWAVKYWRHYIEGLKVEVVTDHASLRFLDSQPMLSRRVTRWVETMQEFDLVIKYKSGKANVLADVLSRYCLNWLKVELNKDEWSNWPVWMVDILEGRLQEIPEGWVEQLTKEKANFEYDSNQGLLFRKEGEKLLGFVPFEQRADLVWKWHAGDGHSSWEEVFRKLSERVWWPGMRSDIRLWCKSCEKCQLFSRDSKIPHEKAHVIEPSSRIFGRWHMDWIGPLPETKNGNKWIWTAVEELTRWPVAVAVNEATHEVAGRLIYENIVVNFGIPDEIISDRGRNFLALALSSYLKLLGVKHVKTSAYHPRTNGKVESLNGLLGRMLAKAVMGARDKWDEFLTEAVFNLRVRKHKTTGYTPFKLVYGVEAKIPGDTTVPFVLKEPEDNYEIRARLLEQLGQDRAAAIARSKESADKAKLRYDKLVKENPLHVGEWVLLRREAKLKFQSKWLGPFEVIESHPSGIYKLRTPEGVEKDDWVHRDRLKRAIIDPENPPERFWTDETLEEMDAVFGQEGNDRV